MGETGLKRQLALDANILFDLAEQRLFAHEFIGFFKEQSFALCVPPTVLAELAFFAEEPDRDKGLLARKALAGTQKWGLIPYEVNPVGKDIAERFSARLREKGLLPNEEKHDGEILAETSLRQIPILVTRDGPLLNVDETSLTIAFQEADLAPVKIVHPRSFLEAAQQILDP